MFLDGQVPSPALRPDIASNMNERSASAFCFGTPRTEATYEHDPCRAAAMAQAKGTVLATFDRLAELSPDIAQALQWIRLGDDERAAALGGSALLDTLDDPNAVLEIGPGLSNVRTLLDALHQAAQLAAQDYDDQLRIQPKQPREGLL